MRWDQARKLLLSVSVVAGSAAYVAWTAANRERPSLPDQALLDPLANPAGPERASTQSDAPRGSPAVLHDGSYTGFLVDAYYGLMQIQITVSGAKVTAIDPVRYPLDREVSRRISYYIIPILETEVVKEQKTDVDMITGATLTVTAYRMSLRDALRQARGG
jgi:uncharacterized protein with FMN-binding domain